MALTKIVRQGIADDAIDGTKLADDAINSEHITDGGIDDAHIGDLAATKLTGTIASGRLRKNIMRDSDMDAIAESIEYHKPDLVMIDPIINFFSGGSFCYPVDCYDMESIPRFFIRY